MTYLEQLLASIQIINKGTIYGMWQDVLGTVMVCTQYLSYTYLGQITHHTVAWATVVACVLTGHYLIKYS